MKLKQLRVVVLLMQMTVLGRVEPAVISSVEWSLCGQ